MCQALHKLPIRTIIARMMKNNPTEANTSSNNNFMMQATILASAGLIARFLGFLYRIPMQNILGDDGTGVYSQSYSLYMLFFVISSAGMPAAISKMVSERTAHKQYRNAHRILTTALVIAGVIGFVGMLVMYFGAYLLADFLSSQHIALSLRALAPTVFVTAVMSVLRGYFQGFNNSVPTAMSQVLEQILNAGFSVFLVWWFIDSGIAAAAAGGTAATSIGAVGGLVLMIAVYVMYRPRQNRRIARERQAYPNEPLEPIGKIAKELVSTAFPIVAGVAVFSMTNVIDMRMVTQILQDTGFSYNEALRMLGQLNGKFVVLTTLPVSVATAIAVAIVPSIAQSQTLGERKIIRTKINTALRFAMIICVPAAVGLSVMADQILLFLFPNNPDGGILLRVGGVSIIFLAISQVSTGILQGMNVLKVPIIAASFGAFMKITFNQLLISNPELNVVGAVIATVLCYATAATINLYFVKLKTGIRINVWRMFGKPLFAAGIMGVVCYVTFATFYMLYPSNTIGLFLAVGMGVVSYGGVMIFLGGITRTELAMMPGGRKLETLLTRMGIELE